MTVNCFWHDFSFVTHHFSAVRGTMATPNNCLINEDMKFVTFIIATRGGHCDCMKLGCSGGWWPWRRQRLGPSAVFVSTIKRSSSFFHNQFMNVYVNFSRKVCPTFFLRRFFLGKNFNIIGKTSCPTSNSKCPTVTTDKTATKRSSRNSIKGKYYAMNI